MKQLSLFLKSIFLYCSPLSCELALLLVLSLDWSNLPAAIAAASDEA